MRTWRTTNSNRIATRLALVGALLTVVVASIAPTNAAMAREPSAPVGQFRWAAVLVAGDDSIDVFDNGIDAIGADLQARGVTIVTALRASDGSATRAGLAMAMGQLAASGAQGCVLYLSSHGSEVGFLLSLESSNLLTPSELDALVDTGCGDKPTAIVISACHSGTFVPAVAAPNRLLITAARVDRTSFGCSADEVYTFFDGCILTTLPTVLGWEQLYAGANQCVSDREQSLGYMPSEPQLSVGQVMVNVALPTAPTTP